jgi:hypothetical protein
MGESVQTVGVRVVMDLVPSVAERAIAVLAKSKANMTTREVAEAANTTTQAVTSALKPYVESGSVVACWSEANGDRRRLFRIGGVIPEFAPLRGRPKKTPEHVVLEPSEAFFRACNITKADPDIEYSAPHNRITSPPLSEQDFLNEALSDVARDMPMAERRENWKVGSKFINEVNELCSVTADEDAPKELRPSDFLVLSGFNVSISMNGDIHLGSHVLKREEMDCVVDFWQRVRAVWP